MAKTYDLRDPDCKAAYIEESAYQWLMYGSVSISLDEETRLVTIYDGGEIERTPDGQGWVLS